jgi:pyruvate dehydrogenase E2 component (dihydrolipoamide acetyltransferase)
VKVDDTVVVDQPIVEVETAKAIIEIPCPFAGVVSHLHADAGQRLPVGHPLIAVMVEDADRSAEVADAGAAGGLSQSGVAGNLPAGHGIAAAPRRRVSVGASAPAGPARVISPLVRRFAQQHGVELRDVVGSGPAGVIVRTDVEREIAARNGTRPPTTVSPLVTAPWPSGVPAEEKRVPLSGIRAAAARKFTRSHAEIPVATCWVDADATELVAVRYALGLGLLPLFARICLTALARYPQFNAEMDPEREEVVYRAAVNMGFAAQSPRGLVVAVVHRADSLSMEELAAELARLTDAARTDKLTPSELTGGTFTLNNYGVFGVDGSTPILNPPESGMLGIGRVADKAWVHQGALAVRKVVQLSFTFDHRVADGADAGGFLRHVADRIEQPIRLLHDP